jgi:Na+-translocating ferredoxin:NAD+ oxidoreductase RnfD subunit
MSAAPRPFAAAQRFFRTPKGLLLVVLAVLVACAAPVEGLRLIGPNLIAAAGVAMAIDAPILRWREGEWVFPSGAVLTGMIVAMVLSPHVAWPVAAATAAIAIASKYVARTRSANVFNPAALGLVAAFYLFGTEQNWWGALGGAPVWAVGAVLATGAFMADRVNKIPMVLAFLGVYYLIFTIAAFVGSPALVAEVYRPPDLQAELYFAFFILTDPPTSPTRYGDQIWCAAIVAVASVAVFELLGAAHYLLAGVLVGNVWEAWRRTRRAAR